MDVGLNRVHTRRRVGTFRAMSDGKVAINLTQRCPLLIIGRYLVTPAVREDTATGCQFLGRRL